MGIGMVQVQEEEQKATTSGGFFYCASFYRYELLRLHFIFPNYKPILYWHD
jgi:hypothetical protein